MTERLTVDETPGVPTPAHAAPVAEAAAGTVSPADAAELTGTATAAAPPVVPLSTGPRLGRFEYKWVALGVVLLGTIMTILDATVVNVAIPTLQTAFSARSYSDIAWVVTAYLLAQGAVIPMTGWATDRFGTKRLYLVTLVMFTVASAACGIAWNLPALVLFRVLQGIGGGMLMPIGMTIILRAVGPSEMGRVMGIFGVPMLLAPAVGPVLGGWFVQDFTWRLIFYVNVPIGAVALVAASRLLVETPTTHRLRLDVVGLLTATPAVLALMYAVDRSSTLGWGAPLVIAMFVASALLFAAFIIRSRSTDEPLLHLELFRDSTFTWSIILGLILVTAMFGAMLLIPIYLQQVHGFDAITTGLLLMPQAATAAVIMPLGGYLADRLGPRPVVLTGLLALTVSSVLLAQISSTSSMWLVIGALALRGAAMGFAMMPGMSAGLARIPRHLTSRASSITNTAQRVGSSLGIAVLVTVLAAQVGVASKQAGCTPSPAVLASAPSHTLTGTAPGAPVTAAALCSALAQRAQSTSNDQREQAHPKPTGSPAFDGFVAGYGNDVLSIGFDRTFAVIAFLSVAAMIPAFFLRRPHGHLGGRTVPAIE